jgi:outer membrane protein assembly factor BamB
MKNKSDFFFGLFLLLFFASCSTNWPQFRGPGADAVSEGNGLPEKWSNDSHILWTFDIKGKGFSSPIIWGNKVFFTAAYSSRKEEPQQLMPPPPPPQQGNPSGNLGRSTGAARVQPPPQQGSRPPEDLSYLKDTITCEVTCVDLKSGKEIWKKIAYQGHPKIRKHPMNTYANETPVTDGKRVYVSFGMTGVFCFDMDGKLLWQKEIGPYETLNGWGTGSSPVVYEDRLFLKVDNDTTSFIKALSTVDGHEIWKMARAEKTTYSTPVIWENKFSTELVTTGLTARSYDPATGKLLWELKMGGEMSISSPTGDKNHIYLSNAGGREKPGVLVSVRAGDRGDITPKKGETVSAGVEWTSLESGVANPSPLLYQGKIYIVGSRGGEFTCVDALTGKNLYRQKIPNTGACWASPWVAGGKILFYDEKGITHIIRAGSVFEELGQNKLDDKFWASPAIKDNCYIFRGEKKLYCVGN